MKKKIIFAVFSVLAVVTISIFGYGLFDNVKAMILYPQWNLSMPWYDWVKALSKNILPLFWLIVSIVLSFKKYKDTSAVAKFSALKEEFIETRRQKKKLKKQQKLEKLQKKLNDIEHDE